MQASSKVALFLSFLLLSLPVAVSSQFDPGERPVWILEILTQEGIRLGTVVVAGSSSHGYRAGNEYWRLDEEGLLAIHMQPSLEFSVMAAGSWTDPWVRDALAWHPPNGSVEWTHPTDAAWTSQREQHPPTTRGGTYFGNATQGGLMIQYSQAGSSSLTWFKLTAGAFMQLEDGAFFQREEEPPVAGAWWHGWIW